MIVLRLYAPGRSGVLEDFHEIGLEECGGVCPAPGDFILASRSQDAGTFWEVKARYFKPKGHNDYIVLVVEERDAGPQEINLF